MNFNEKLISGVLIKRYKRFFVDVKIGSITVTAHCPNTGSMLGLLNKGNKVWLTKVDNPNRKLKYTLQIIENQKSKVGINTAGEDLPLTYNLEVSGSIRASQAVLSNSDERLKENIKPIEGALGKIISSNGVSFNRTESPDIKELGVIAQQIENYIPEVVYKDKKDYLSVNYGGIVPVLIEAIKELEARVQELENK